MNCDTAQKGQGYDLVIIGSGAASFAGAIKAAELGKRVAIIERSTLGGTCVNVGCVPSKTLLRAAEARDRALRPNFKGIIPSDVDFDFPTIIDEKNHLVESLREAKYRDVLRTNKAINFIEGEAAFSSAHEVMVGKQLIRGKRFLIATGASPHIPPISGLDTVPYLTSATAFELDRLPPSVTIIGGRYIALELAQMFRRMGSKVTVLQRSERILPTEDPDLTAALTGYLEEEGISILTGVTLRRIKRKDTFVVFYEKDGRNLTTESTQLIMATGRKPDIQSLRLNEISVALNRKGGIETNKFNQTTQPHIYAAGDVIDSPAFVYTAAYEGKLAVENAFGGNTTPRDYSVVPHVVFTDPQVAGVGINELTASQQGLEVEVAKLTLDSVPRAIAARDSRGFIKLLKGKGTDYLIGASILAPEGSELLMETTLAIRYKIPVTELAAMFHPYLTLAEGIKLAAQAFNKDISKLSCCAS